MKKDKIFKKTISSILVFFIFLIILIFLNFQNEIKKEKLFESRKEFKTNLILPNNDQLERKIENLNKKINGLNGYIFENNSPVLFIEEIENLSVELGLNTQIQNAESNFIEEENRGEIKITIYSEGSLALLREFLYRIESLEKEIDVELVRLSKASEEGTTFWTGSFNIVAKTK